jgi:hypothetical protein
MNTLDVELMTKDQDLSFQRTHTGKAAGLSQARERWRVYDVAREVQAAC